MKTINLLENVSFKETIPNSEALFADEDNRILLFSFKPHQVLEKHNSPKSPVVITVLKGKGVFTGGDGKEEILEPNSLIVFSVAENHSVRALDEELIFMAILNGVIKTHEPVGTMA